MTAASTIATVPPGPVQLAVDETAAVGPEGAVAEIDEATVTIPPEAIGPEPIDVTVFRAPARAAAAGEVLLVPPVGVVLGGELLSPVELRFPLPSEIEVIPELVYSVRWDDASGQWVTVWDDEVEVTDSEIVVRTAQFSELSLVQADTDGWDSRLSNWAGRLLGTRAGPPECNPESVPSWVRDVIYTYNLAAELLVCTETEGDVLVIKIVNNRTYTMLLTADRTLMSVDQLGVTDDALEAIYSVIGLALPEGVTYMPPLSEWEVRLAGPSDLDQLTTTLEGRLLANSITADLTLGVLEALNIPVVGPVLEIVELLSECVVNEGLGVANSDPLAIVRAMISCLALFDENGAFDRIIEAGVRSGLLDEAAGRALASIAPFLRLMEAGQFVNMTLDLLVDTFLLEGDPTISVFARRQALVCDAVAALPLPEAIASSGEGVVLVYDFYDDGATVYDFVLRVDGSDDGSFYVDGELVATGPVDDEYITSQWGEDGAYVAYVVEDGEITLCDSVELARGSAGIGSGWPTGRDDSVTGLYVWFGANFVFPSWVSCFDFVCLAGIGEDVWVIRIDSGFDLVAEIPLESDPYQSLADLGGTDELIAGLLAPEAP